MKTFITYKHIHLKQTDVKPTVFRARLEGSARLTRSVVLGVSHLTEGRLGRHDLPNS